MASDLLDNDPLWYKDAIIYELHVRAFCDSNADGIGDFKGLTQKLDYLQDLGITAISFGRFRFVLLPYGMMAMIFRITPTFIPTMEDIQLLLDGYILQKALYELGYELNNRPDWIQIPLEGILQIAESA